MQYVVTGGPDGDVKYYWVLEDGKLLESQLGEIADPDFTMTLDLRRTRSRSPRATLDANAAFMQGRMKVAGNMGKLMTAAAPHDVARVQGAPGADPRPVTEY